MHAKNRSKTNAPNDAHYLNTIEPLSSLARLRHWRRCCCVGSTKSSLKADHRRDHPAPTPTPPARPTLLSSRCRRHHCPIATACSLPWSSLLLPSRLAAASSSARHRVIIVAKYHCHGRRLRAFPCTSSPPSSVSASPSANPAPAVFFFIVVHCHSSPVVRRSPFAVRRC